MAKQDNTRSPNLWRWVYYLIVIVGLSYFFLNLQGTAANEVSWNQFAQNIYPEQQLEKIIVVNREIAEIYLKDNEDGDNPSFFSSRNNPDFLINLGSVETFEENLLQLEKSSNSAATEILYENRTNWWGTIISWMLPLLLIILIWSFVLRRGMGSRMGSTQITNFGKTQVQSMQKTTGDVSFDDVAGLDRAKEEVIEIINFLKHPEQFTRLGARIPKGVLLIGPPGTGKTLLARAMANKAEVPFFAISGPEFVEMFVGVGASRVRDLFDKAKASSPSIIFIDEIDAIGKRRGKNISFASNDEHENTLNQLLAEMDGFEKENEVIVLAATNRPDILDKALLRAGRFDRHIYLELPTRDERIDIFNVHLKNLTLAPDIQVKQLASQTPGFSGADIANLCNEAALIAARHQRPSVTPKDFAEALDRVIGGLERSKRIISAKEKEIIAYHESGHALVSWLLPTIDPLFKVTIIPRGKALGAAWYLPEEHKILTRSQLEERLVVAMGGRAAEEIIFGEPSSGAMDDLEKATKQAYAMIAHLGLGQKLGAISYSNSGEFERSFQKPYSEETAKVLDREVRDLLNASYSKAKQLISRNLSLLKALAEELMKKEILNRKDLEEILGERFEDQSSEIIEHVTKV